MIFGNSNRKLRPDGPFLQLRHEFEKRLMATNRLLVVGYSFGDDHLNSIVRRWVATRTSAKMVIIDPGKVDWSKDVFTSSYALEGGKLRKKTVDMVHVRKTAADGLVPALSALKQRVDLRIDRTKGGYLPHILVRVID